MTSEAHKAMYLAKAKEAERQAESVHDPNVRAEWLKIAQAYRQLAKTA